MSIQAATDDNREQPSNEAHEKRMEAERLLKEARKCLFDDPDTAIDHLEVISSAWVPFPQPLIGPPHLSISFPHKQAAMKLHESIGLSDHPSSAPLYAAYGCALVESARANSDVFGAKAAPAAVAALGPSSKPSSAAGASIKGPQQKKQKVDNNKEEHKEQQKGEE